MPYDYQLDPAARNELATKLYDYYTDELDAGMRGLMDRMAQSNMGVVTAALDRGRDTWAGLTAESRDKFTVKFEREVRSQASLMFAGATDLAADALPIATKAITSLLNKIPVPLVGAALSKLVELGSGAAVTELRARALNEADARVTGATGAEVRRLFTSDEAAKEAMVNALEQYKLVGRYISTIPTAMTSFQDVVTFPKSVFKVREAASALNVSLLQIRDYVDSMQTRLEGVQKVYSDYAAKLKVALPEGVDVVLDSAYKTGYQKAEVKYRSNQYKPIAEPSYRAPAESGGATHLAAQLTYALAMGYYDYGNYQMVNTTRGRGSVMTGENGPRRR